MRLKKLTRVKKSRRSQAFTLATLAKRFARARKARKFTWEGGMTAAAVVAICVAVGAMLSAALGSDASTDNTIASATSRTAPAQTVAASTAWTADDVLAEASAPTAAAPQTPVTITGCLELDDETYRLKNTSGTQAPKARSWKSGFLKKNAATIEVVDASNRAQLPSHVGQRVVVTGMLVNREMQVRSLRRVATSCGRTA